MSTSPRATFSRSLAISLGLILVILLLGRALLAVVDLPAPVAQMLGSDAPSIVRLSPPASSAEATQPVRLGTSRDRASTKTRARRTWADRPATRKRTRTTSTASQRTRARISPGGRGVGSSNTSSGLPSTDTTAPAPATVTTPSTSTGASTTPTRSLTRKMTLQVADVSTTAGTDASSALMRLTLADAETGGAPATASVGLPPKVDLKLDLKGSEVVALAGSAPIDGPVALSTRVDVVDDAGTGTAPEMRVRMRLVSVGSVVSEPSVGDTGDAGGLSNTVEVVVPVDSGLFSDRADQPHGVASGSSSATATTVPESEVRLRLATAQAGEPAPELKTVSDDAQLTIPTDATTASNSTPPTVQVAVELKTIELPTPPADTTPTPDSSAAPAPTTSTTTPGPDPAGPATAAAATPASVDAAPAAAATPTPTPAG